MIGVERTDFISVPVQDMERATRFYTETLGIRNASPNAAWPELETGNISLYLVDPTKIGATFAPHTAHIALRVPDVAEARKQLEEVGVEFEGEILDTGVCRDGVLQGPGRQRPDAPPPLCASA